MATAGLNDVARAAAARLESLDAAVAALDSGEPLGVFAQAWRASPVEGDLDYRPYGNSGDTLGTPHPVSEQCRLHVGGCGERRFGNSGPPPALTKGRHMGKAWQLLLMAAFFGAVLWLGPDHASAATSKCHFSKKEKIAMVSWVMLVPGAVITGLSCKRNLFQQVGKRDTALPAKNRSRTEVRTLDRRGRGGL